MLPSSGTTRAQRATDSDKEKELPAPSHTLPFAMHMSFGVCNSVNRL